jgi:hypothetical protein
MAGLDFARSQFVSQSRSVVYPGNIFQASVTTLDFARMWYKMYPSKLECVADLSQLGLLTIMDHDDVLKSDFDTKDRILTTTTSAESEALDEAGFVAITPAKLN